MADAMQELVIDQLRDLYDAEKQLTKALPKLAKAAADEELKQGFREHLEQTQGHVQRIEQIFEHMGQRAKSKPCEAMKGLVREGQEAIEEDLEKPAGDVGLIAAARRVEHYEMAAYSTLLIAVQALKNSEVAGLLQQTLSEELETDKKLTAVAKRLVKEAGKPAPSGGPSGPGTKKSASASAGSPASSRSGKNAGGNGAAKKAAPKKSASSSKKGSPNGSGDGDHTSHTTTDHEEIRAWAEERGGKPACVRGTGKKGDIGLMRIEFPGSPYANDSKLEEISWDEFFEKFDDQGLALVYQKVTAGGEQSNFNKIVAAASAKSR